MAARLQHRAYWGLLGQKVKHAAWHTWLGFKLLWADTRIASRLVWQQVNGHRLTRRERQQLLRTVSDLFRLVPFSAFIIVPGAELLLPFAVKYFPGILPTQFRDTETEAAKTRAQLRVKISMAHFLTEALDEMAKTRDEEKGGSEGRGTLAEFTDLLRRGQRTGGTYVPNSELMRFSKLFDEEYTLDSLPRKQLEALCRIQGLQTLGPDTLLMFQIRMNLRRLRSDDVMIGREGVESLTVTELQQACRDRGMRALGVSEPRLREQLAQWIKLHTVTKMPVLLLLLSRALYLPENVEPEQKLAAAIEGLPENVKEDMEDAEAKPLVQERLEELEEQEELIAKEREVIRSRAKEEGAKEPPDATIEAEVAQERERRSAEAAQAAVAQAKEAKEEATRVSAAELHQLAVGLSAASDTVSDAERVRDLIEAVRQDAMEIELAELAAERGIDQRAAAKARKEARARLAGSANLAKVVRSMLGRMQHGDDAGAGSEQDRLLLMLDRNGDGFVSTEELMLVMKRLVDKSGNAKEKRGERRARHAALRALARKFDADHDGVISVPLLRKVLAELEAEGTDVTVERPEALELLIDTAEAELAAQADGKGQGS